MSTLLLLLSVIINVNVHASSAQSLDDVFELDYKQKITEIKYNTYYQKYYVSLQIILKSNLVKKIKFSAINSFSDGPYFVFDHWKNVINNKNGNSIGELEIYAKINRGPSYARESLLSLRLEDIAKSVAVSYMYTESYASRSGTGNEVTKSWGQLSVNKNTQLIDLYESAINPSRIESSTIPGSTPTTPSTSTTQRPKPNTDLSEGIYIQRREDDTVSFKRNWTEYENGFGNFQSNYWMGLKNIYNLVKNEPVNITFVMYRFDDVGVYTAHYTNFQIAGPEDKYRLTLSGYNNSSTVNDSLSMSDDPYGNINNMQFSTIDQDNDLYNTSCAGSFGGGGWWYNSCHDSNPNGILYPKKTKSDQAVNWFSLDEMNSLKKFAIIIKKRI